MKYNLERKEFDSLLSDQGYSLRELAHLFGVVCRMDKMVRRWTIRWMLGMGLPSEVIEGVTVPMLIEEGFKPMNAFIIMDWLLEDPDAAKYTLAQGIDRVTVSQETVAEIQSLLERENQAQKSEEQIHKEEEVIHVELE